MPGDDDLWGLGQEAELRSRVPWNPAEPGPGAKLEGGWLEEGARFSINMYIYIHI